MWNWTRKRNKRLTGTACLLLSLFLFAVPLLGMAAENRGSDNGAVACVCDHLCIGEAFNLECPVCRENAGTCTGQGAKGEPEQEKPPCFCEKRCTKENHNLQCPACAADMDLCAAQTAGEPPAACSCADKCREDFFNQECALCRIDRTKCAGKEPAVPKFTISILSPDGWYTRKAKVTIRVRDVNGTGLETVEAKINSGGSWVDLTDDLVEKEKTTLEISENCTIYVTVTDKNGKTHTKNRYIEVFDREAPSVRAGIDGEMLRVEASDDLSGVDQIFVCGSAFSSFNNGTLDVRLKDYADEYQQITIQATDNAGNKSAMTQLKNPYYEEPKKETGAGLGSAMSPTGQSPAAQNPAVSPAVPGAVVSGGGTTTTGSQKGNSALSGQSAGTGASGQPSGNGSEKKDPSAVSPTAMEEPEDNPFTPDGTATVVDNATDSQGKEFYTIMTPEENVFYLVIDKQRDGENVYFLNAVTESDLMALAQKDTQAQAAVTEPAKTPEETKPAAEPLTPSPTQAEEPKEEPETPAPKSGNGILFFVLMIALIGGGLGYYFKIYKPNHELDDAEDIDDFDFQGPQEPMVNEDEDTGFERAETPDLSEEEEAEQRRLYEEDNEDIPIEGDDDLVF